MADTRAEAQAKRNIAVVRQRQALRTHGAGSTEHLAAMDETRRHGDAMRAAVAAGDTSSASNIVTVHNVDDYVSPTGGLLKSASESSSVSHLASGGGGGGGGGDSATPYSDYVESYPDLIKHYREVIAPTGVSMEAWGAAHWRNHGSTSDKRSLSGPYGSSVSTADAGPGTGTWGGTETSPDTRMGYDPSGSIDFTNSNPAYWTSVVSYFKAHPDGNPTTGELGIWVPNFEKEGNERVALAAIAGGVRAYENSNYANRTVTDEGRAVRVDGSLFGPGTSSYTGTTTEKPIRLAGTHRGGVTTETGYPMGSTPDAEHGVHILGGEVVKGAGGDYVTGGGDFGGLLSVGDTITGDWLTGVLGPMDSDGMRIGGTYPAVKGATGSGVGAGGTDITVGGTYAGGVDPIGSMPAVADYTAYMDPNSMFGGLSENEAVRSGLLYQPTASDYGAKMEAAGMPAFSPGLLGGFSGAGSPTYGSTPGSFTKPGTGGAGGGGGGAGSGLIGSPAAAYDIPDTIWGYDSSLIPKFASTEALNAIDSTIATGGTGHWGYTAGTGYTPGAFVGGTLYTPGAGDSTGGLWDVYRTYPASTTT